MKNLKTREDEEIDNLNFTYYRSLADNFLIFYYNISHQIYFLAL